MKNGNFFDFLNLNFSLIKLVNNVNFVKMGAILFGPYLQNPNSDLDLLFEDILYNLQISQVRIYKNFFKFFRKL